MTTKYFCYFALILFTLLLVSPPTASRMLKSSSEAPATTNVVETNTKAPTNEATHGEEKNFLGFGGLGGFGGVGGGAGVIGPHGGFGFGSGIGGGSGVGGFTGVGPLGGAAGIGGAGGVGGAGGAAGIP